MNYRCFRYFFLCSFLLTSWIWAQDDLIQEEADLIQSEEQSPSQIIIYENPQKTAPLVNEQAPENIYAAPIPTRQQQITQERQKAEQETQNTIQERLELMRIRDEKERLRKLIEPLDNQPNVIREGAPRYEYEAPVRRPAPKKTSRPYFLSFGIGRLNFNNYSITQSFLNQSGINDIRHGPSYNYSYGYGYNYYGYGYNYGYNNYNPNFFGTRQQNYFRDRYIASNYLLSASIGVHEGERLAFEYKITASGHAMTPDVVSGERRFLFISHTGILKYFLSPGKVRPFVGAGVSFNQRYAVAPIFFGIPSLYHSFVVGPVVGLEIFFGNRWAIGAMGKYTINVYQLTSNRDFFFNENAVYYPQRIPEEMDIVVGDIYLKTFF